MCERNSRQHPQQESFSQPDRPTAADAPLSTPKPKPFLSMTMSELQAEFHRLQADIAAKDKRIVDLLAANNAEVERRRAAERNYAVAVEQLSAAIIRAAKAERDANISADLLRAAQERANRAERVLGRVMKATGAVIVTF